jgi:hypothetical protein
MVKESNLWDFLDYLSLKAAQMEYEIKLNEK